MTAILPIGPELDIARLMRINGKAYTLVNKLRFDNRVDHEVFQLRPRQRRRFA